MNKKPYILGLDIGTNSIGWAVVDCQISTEKNKPSPRLLPTGLRAFNSRIFQEMVEKKTREPKNKQRREARGRRRGLARHKGARLALYKLLIKNKLLPEDMRFESPEESLNDIDRKFAERQTGKQWSSDWSAEEKNWATPFAMRAVGLKQSLQPHEFGRVLLQLQQKRGYFSNRGAKYIDLYEELGITDKQEEKEIANGEVQKGSAAGDGKKDKLEDKTEADERRVVLGGIIELEKEMKNMQCETIGEFVWKKSQTEKLPAKRVTNYCVETIIKKGRKEGEISQVKLYGNRSLYKKEFALLWEQQKENLNLSEELREEVHKIIFYQRPLKIQKNLVGRCSFLIAKPRAAKALLEAQECRIRTAINHIKVQRYGQPDYEPLTSEQRELLYEALNDPEKLNKQGRLSYTEVRKILGLQAKKKRGSEGLNLEEGEGIDSSAPNDGGFSKSGIVGNLTHQAMMEIIPEQWKKLNEAKRKNLVEDLLTIHDKLALYNRLINKYDNNKSGWRAEDGSPLFTEEQAFDLACAELEAGYANHCLKVIKTLLPYLRDGKIYSEACDKSGYWRTEQKKKEIEKLEEPPEIANPIVQKALYEIRKLVNSIIRKYGKPAAIRVEIAREMRASKEQRTKIQKQQTDNRKLNEYIEGEIIKDCRSGDYSVDKLKETNSGQWRVDRKIRERYKLWMELGEAKAICPYSGEPIASYSEMLHAEVDHIIPLSRSNDDSYLNKILCLRSENQDKGQKTPWEAWGNDKEKYYGIIGRMQKLSKTSDQRFQKGLKIKLEKMKLKEIPEDFTAAQLKATQYIAVATRKYLETLDVEIGVTAGSATAELRRLWGLNGLLPKPPEDEEDSTKEIINGKEVTRRTAEQVAKSEAKSRIDHRHHAIDALVVALTDLSIYANLQERYKDYEESGKWPDTELALPRLWEEQDVQINREKVRERIMKAVVSHMVNHKICGSLHKESAYGMTHYYDELKLTANPKKEIIETIKGNPDNFEDTCYVWDRNIRQVLQNWIENLPQQKTERALPEYNGAKLDKVTIAYRCYVKKIPVEEALQYVNVDKEWKPGKGSWIQNKNTYNVLRDWKLAGNEKKDLIANPPKMKNKKNPDKSHPIKSVRIARKFSPVSIQGLNENTKFFELGSNHHVAIFRCIKEHTEPETKAKRKKGEQIGKFVTMMEAAQRASEYRKSSRNGNKIKQIVHRKPEQYNLDDDCWEFVMTLSINDLVRWDEDDIPEEHKGLGEPIYRVQIISGAVELITFRHHTVSTTGGGYGRLIKQPNTLRCDKILVDMLGNIISKQG